MIGSYTTTTSVLLEGLHDPANDSVWREFDGRYRPIIVGFAQRLGLTPADAADAAQETMVQFLRDYRAGKYERGRGRLRSWIIGIARHRVADLHRRKAARKEWRGVSAIAELPDEQGLTEIWDAECQRAILAAAFAELEGQSRLNARTIQAFKLQAVDQTPPAEIAATLGMSLRAVYLAKHRCLGRLREIMSTLTAAYETA